MNIRKREGLPPHELAKVKIWLGLQKIKLDPPDQQRDKDDKTKGDSDRRNLGGTSSSGD